MTSRHTCAINSRGVEGDWAYVYRGALNRGRTETLLRWQI